MGGKTVTVIGGGLVGAAIAYGAARCGLNVRVLDQGDSAFRASRGNFGLVWLSSKGATMPRYAAWTRDALALWPALAKELLDLTGVDTALRQDGGFWFGFSDAEVADRARLLTGISEKVDGIPFQMMESAELRRHFPGLGPAVAGGSFCPLDGDANPLMLLRGLHTALHMKGAEVINGVDVTEIQYGRTNNAFEIASACGGRWTTDRVVLAAGLGNAKLAPQVGLFAPVRPSRGQVLVTERLKPFLRYPLNKLRQTNEGSVQIGSSTEDVGLNDGTTTGIIEWQVRRAVATFPALAQARLVRAWGALRPLMPDNYPLYEESVACPGAYVVTTHSGVSLAAAHCFIIGPWTAGVADTPPDFDIFRSERFSDPKANAPHAH